MTKQLKPGSHLVSSRDVYTHHGLFIGGNKVIHYSGLAEGLKKGCISVTTLKEFSAGKGYQVVEHLVRVYGPKERIRRAQSRIGEDEYSVIFNNCEHFVNWCFLGFGYSSQVNMVAGNLVCISQRIVPKVAVPPALELLNLSGLNVSLQTGRTIQGAQLLAPIAANSVAPTAVKALVPIAAHAVTASTAPVIASSTVAGLATSAGVAGFTASTVGTAAFVSVVGTTAATVAAPVVVAVAAGLGVKAVWDWLTD